MPYCALAPYRTAATKACQPPRCVSAVLCEVLRTIERNSNRATIEPNERAALDTLAKRLTVAIHGMPTWL